MHLVLRLPCIVGKSRTIRACSNFMLFGRHAGAVDFSQTKARSNVHTPRSTLAAWSGRGGAALQPLFDLHREFVLGAQVLQADRI